MIVLERAQQLRDRCEQARRGGGSVGLVPTMGSFHEGHRSLMRTARAETDFVVVTLFVNPTQFGPNEDLAAYPRDFEGDRAIAAAEGADVLFAPSVDEMYPDGPPLTTVHVARLTDGLCGAARPGHFDGVTTVVTKLFSIVGPSSAFFGRKDYQQLAVIRQMAVDLDLPVSVRGCPLVREPDGIAMSSRNAYLSEEERVAARVLSQSLRAAADSVIAGERDAREVEATVRRMVDAEPLVALEYDEVRDARTLEPRESVEGEVVLAVAAGVGRAPRVHNVLMAGPGSEGTGGRGGGAGEREPRSVP